ncbi:hypothetical protein AURDEDRAFT_176273 [Auricularia subglabra TFB-10046 SS5]|uniref:Uncharacterized protein n=1 Tax=Auricularia subglabra (strain TFB-10046 / SS5) TaxID=717982 RepID=J0CW24_AURST|nr:hypothetical protein AURDEDRAFT_176273 [Auricularia subglabra TFB-10046 SS5]
MNDRFVLITGDSEQEVNEKCNATQPGTQYKAMDRESPEWLGVFSSPSGEWTLTYDSLYDPDPTVPKTEGLEPRAAVLVKFVHQNMPELDCWYNEEHLKMLRVVPGWIRSWRYRLEGSDTVVLALHEYTGERSFESAEIKAARSTEWRQRIMDSADLVEKRVLQVWGKK